MALIYGLAFFAVLSVCGYAIHDVRARRAHRVQARLRELVQQGELLLATERPDTRACCAWGSDAAERVQRLLVPAVSEQFVGTIRELLVGAEAMATSGSSAATGFATRDVTAVVRSGVAWLRRRTWMLGPNEVRGLMRRGGR